MKNKIIAITTKNHIPDIGKKELCKECDEPIGECVCIDCGEHISDEEREYDHMCGQCSFHNARL